MFNIFRIIIPKKLRRILRVYLKKLSSYSFFKHDANRFLKYSNTIYDSHTAIKLLNRMIAKYHVIEKGLTMPEIRLGFGKEVVITLLNNCNTYIERNYDLNNIQFRSSVGVLLEYSLIHEKYNFKIEPSIISQIKYLVEKLNYIHPINQLLITENDYLKYTNSAFDEFSQSRHSIRNFNGEIKIEDLLKAIKLSQNAPSSCNRQASRVHIITKPKSIKQILAIQKGNRGFGHLINSLLIVTVELSCYGSILERNMPYVDGGIYAMNLLYSLHFYRIGTCTLNWGDSPEIDRDIRNIIHIPDTESIVLVIACGKVPYEIKVARSTRYELDNIITFH